MDEEPTPLLLPPGDEPQAEPAEPGESLPDHIRVLKNGALYDTQLKRIVGNPPGGTTNRITRESSRQMHERRRSQARERVLRGIAEGTRQADWRAGIQAIAAANAQIASDPSRGRAATFAMKTLMELGGLHQQARSSEEDPASALTLRFSGDAMREIMALIGQKRQND